MSTWSSLCLPDAQFLTTSNICPRTNIPNVKNSQNTRFIQLHNTRKNRQRRIDRPWKSSLAAVQGTLIIIPDGQMESGLSQIKRFRSYFIGHSTIAVADNIYLSTSTVTSYQICSSSDGTWSSDWLVNWFQMYSQSEFHSMFSFEWPTSYLKSVALNISIGLWKAIFKRKNAKNLILKFEFWNIWNISEMIKIASNLYLWMFRKRTTDINLHTDGTNWKMFEKKPKAKRKTRRFHSMKNSLLN